MTKPMKEAGEVGFTDLEIIPLHPDTLTPQGSTEYHGDIETARALETDKTYLRALAKASALLEQDRENYLRTLPHTD